MHVVVHKPGFYLHMVVGPSFIFSVLVQVSLGTLPWRRHRLLCRNLQTTSFFTNPNGYGKGERTSHEKTLRPSRETPSWEAELICDRPGARVQASSRDKYIKTEMR